jgi:hypothetical protein
MANKGERYFTTTIGMWVLKVKVAYDDVQR